MKNIVLFDLEETISNSGNCALRLVKEPKDSRALYAERPADIPVKHIVEILKALQYRRYEIWIVSGRSDEIKAQTEHWLSECTISYDRLIMRKKGDFTEESMLKTGWLHDGTIPKERIFCVFEDKTSVVDAWRSEGLPCLQVTEGDTVSRLRTARD